MEVERVKLGKIYLFLARYTSTHEKNDQMALDLLEEANKHWRDSEEVLKLQTEIYFK